MWLFDEFELREGIPNAFQSLLTNNMEWRAELDGLPFTMLSLEDVTKLGVAVQGGRSLYCFEPNGW